MTKYPMRLNPSAGLIGLSLLLMAAGIWGSLSYNTLTISGVPLPLVIKFATDEQARDAYFKKENVRLHQRLQELGAEEDIKAFYRPQIPDEDELDQFIHQKFYDLSGYVGQAYRVDDQGQLIHKYSKKIDPHFARWMALARKLGIVTGSIEENQVQYVIAPNGARTTYAEAAQLMPLETLEELANLHSPP